MTDNNIETLEVTEISEDTETDTCEYIFWDSGERCTLAPFHSGPHDANPSS